MDLVISGSPDLRLVRGTPLHETAPRVPAGVILVGVRVGVRKVFEEEKSLGFPRILFIVGERLDQLSDGFGHHEGRPIVDIRVPFLLLHQA